MTTSAGLHVFLFAAVLSLPFTVQSQVASPLVNEEESSSYMNGASSFWQLPPELLNTSVSYPEERDTYVRYPENADELLAEEIARYPEPLTLEVTTVVTHWTNPLWELLKGIVHRFRAQNQIIYVKPHNYVGNGLKDQFGCRIQFEDADETIVEQSVESEACQQHCTNHGRYCAPEVPNDWNPANPPTKLVEETLRRLCIDELYHASDLKHFEYLDSFRKFQCHRVEDFTGCAKLALAEVEHTEWAHIEECMQLSGGLEADVMNVRLQEELDRQEGSYTLADIPLLHISGARTGEPYMGAWTTHDIFNSICAAYPESQHLPVTINPLACDFCRDCQDVRRCLWFLTCDGKDFDIHTFRGNVPDAGSNQNNTDPPETALAAGDSASEAIAPPPTNPPSAASTVQQTPVPTQTTTTPPLQSTTATPAADVEELNTRAYFAGGILAGFVFGLLPAIWFARHEKRTRHDISAAIACREQGFRDSALDGGHYKDELELSSGKRGRPSQEELQNMEDVTLDEFGSAVITTTGNSPPKRAPLELLSMLD